MLTAERAEYRTINFEETELRLGIPGNNHESGGDPSVKKRGFSETDADAESSVDLKLNLSTAATAKDSKLEATADQKLKAKVADRPAKSQVVGWPPVRSYRNNIVSLQKKSSDETTDQKTTATSSGAFVKVSMDGAPYLRKVDLKLYKSYQQLSDALAKMFSSFTVGNDSMKENKLIDLVNGTDYVAIYEDKDGDWMLVGDVPWEMLVNTCKRLRIMKGTDAIGLGDRFIPTHKYITRTTFRVDAGQSKHSSVRLGPCNTQLGNNGNVQINMRGPHNNDQRKCLALIPCQEA